MTFATTRQILAMTVLWAILLFGLDLWLDPRGGIWNRDSTTAAEVSDQPQLRIWLRYPCRSTCLTTVNDALEDIEWLGPKKLVGHKSIFEESTTQQAGEAYLAETNLMVNRVEAPVTNLKTLDFMEVVEALEDIGLVADRIEFVGGGHYTIDARIRIAEDMASKKDTQKAVVEALGNAQEAVEHLVSEYSGRGYYSWYDSVAAVDPEDAGDTVGIDPVSGALRFYPDLSAKVDVMEILRALSQVGLRPHAIVVETERAR